MSSSTENQCPSCLRAIESEHSYMELRTCLRLVGWEGISPDYTAPALVPEPTDPLTVIRNASGNTQLFLLLPDRDEFRARSGGSWIKLTEEGWADRRVSWDQILEHPPVYVVGRVHIDLGA